jgi:hypothetical protein
VKAMCSRSGQASLTAAPIEVLSGLKNTKFQTYSHLEVQVLIRMSSREAKMMFMTPGKKNSIIVDLKVSLSVECD